MDVLLLFGLIALNGLFAMSEIALVTARKVRLKKLAAEGDKAAQTALKLGEDPTAFLSTVQIGITSIGILSGILGDAVLSGPLSAWLQQQGIAAATAKVVSTISVVVFVTYISIVVGELVPKRLGQINPEPIARLVARPMRILSLLTAPFVLLLTFSTNLLLRLLCVRQDNSYSVTEEEIKALLEEGSEAGVIEPNEHNMVRNVFRLDDRQTGSLMVPRTNIVFIDIRLPPEENLQRIISSEHSRFPVCDGGLENLLGVIHAKHALAYAAKGKDADYLADLKPCVYVPETLNGMDLLEQFRSSNMQMVFVVDEYGEIEGIVTLQDVLEAVTGEFASPDPDDSRAIQREDGSWLLDGSIPVIEMKDILELKGLPEEEKGRYHTLSGMIMLLLGRIPVTGEQTIWEGWIFEVIDMDEKRIDKVLVRPEITGNND